MTIIYYFFTMGDCAACHYRFKRESIRRQAGSSDNTELVTSARFIFEPVPHHHSDNDRFMILLYR